MTIKAAVPFVLLFLFSCRGSGPPELADHPLHCSNAHVDADETDTDCGGKCGACPLGMLCASDFDCADGPCIDYVCTAACDTSNAIDTDGDGRFDDCDDDDDGDGVDDDQDNCAERENPGQLDTDHDGRGDPCDDDDDGDGVDDWDDNCRLIANADQEDGDGDGHGSPCDDDDDGDEVPDDDDCCHDHPNPDQADANHDGIGDACTDDDDGDGVLDDDDNCIAVSNAEQLDTDGDGQGDACDPDDDNDGVDDDADNCSLVANPDQADANGDGHGDACCGLVITDDDGDGVENAIDNCPLVANDDQADADGDGLGDACDPLTDSDDDGIADSGDNCPLAANADQADNDGDGLGDACDDDDDNDGAPDATDTCPLLADADQTDTDNDGLGNPCDDDDDGDGVADSSDNCPLVANADQLDSDGDGQGNSCDEDSDNDGTPDVADCQPFDPSVHPAALELCDSIDNNCNGAADEGNPGGGDSCDPIGICAAGLTQCTGGTVVCQAAGPIPSGADTYNECSGASCQAANYYHGYVGNTCFYKGGSYGNECNGSGQCRAPSEDCPLQGQGNSTGVSRATCQTASGCSGTLAPLIANASVGTDPSGDCGGGRTCNGSGTCCRAMSIWPGGTWHFTYGGPQAGDLSGINFSMSCGGVSGNDYNGSVTCNYSITGNVTGTCRVQVFNDGCNAVRMEMDQCSLPGPTYHATFFGTMSSNTFGSGTATSNFGESFTYTVSR